MNFMDSVGKNTWRVPNTVGESNQNSKPDNDLKTDKNNNNYQILSILCIFFYFLSWDGGGGGACKGKQSDQLDP